MDVRAVLIVFGIGNGVVDVQSWGWETLRRRK
jgi:hypothetical protein